jgi:molybdopterin-containing oxidoreductase family iron-sulfur binding subunit
MKTNRLRVLSDAEIEPEFAPGVDAPWDPVSRRAFLKYAGASLALAGQAACNGKPAESALPYSRQPPEITPGVPLFYATSMVMSGLATGLLVEAHEGRPTKVEGNPDHPASLGSTGVFEQALILGLYDPDRASTLRERTTPRTWRRFAERFAPHEIEEERASGRTPPPQVATLGRGLHFLLEPTSSPFLLDMIDRVRARYPEAEFHFYDPLASPGAEAASRAVFGHHFVPLHRFDQADVVLALDSNFLAEGPSHVADARRFMSRRRLRDPSESMNRLYAVESNYSPTGTVADHRLPVRSRDVLTIASDLARIILKNRPSERAVERSNRIAHVLPSSGLALDFVNALARDLIANAGRSAIVVGPRQSEAVHAIALLLNAVLENVGRTVAYVPSPLPDAGAFAADLARLATAIDEKRVERLVILGGNPVYTAPADISLRERIAQVPESVYLGPYENETSSVVKWFVPLAHALESWGDARAFDGTVSFVQPLIEPLHNGRTIAEVLSLFLGEPELGARALFRRYWRNQKATDDALAEYTRSGVIEGSAYSTHRLAMDLDAAAAILASIEPRTPDGRRSPGLDEEHDLEIGFFADPRVRDGAFTNNPWLLELPDPLTKLTWDNAALLSPRTAQTLSIETNDRILLRHRGRAVEARAFVLPGHADRAVSVTLGWGRSSEERAARGAGFNAYLVRTSTDPWFAAGLAIEKLPVPMNQSSWRDREALASLTTTQRHWTLEGRPLVLEAPLSHFRENASIFQHANERKPSLRADWPVGRQQWGMTIDLSACTGCNACMVACQAENNVPVVGKINVQKRREMHWIRIDRYLAGSLDNPRYLMQPMLCQHCEHAPCEYVCPVNATVHSFDGLNEMVYNRCVGTRFCSNNCPYKVRRFNWFNFNSEKTFLEMMATNPDVTVRDRGVMEKCTYCVQRIRAADIRARIENRPIRDGEVVPACAQACPTRAIVFGNILDPGAEVTKLRANHRAYGVLSEIGTEPRTRYLARISNPNPAIAAGPFELAGEKMP